MPNLFVNNSLLLLFCMSVCMGIRGGGGEEEDWNLKEKSSLKGVFVCRIPLPLTRE